jgi:SAM-dependent methyltransferase
MEAHAPCPICGQVDTAAIQRMGFGDKPHLPAVVTLRFCPDCDFAFTWPRDAEGYRAYYASVSNDLTQRHGQYRNTRQVEILAELIAANAVRSVLDFGCGGGGLAHALAARFPEVAFLGFDVNADFPSGLPNLRFTSALPDQTFDLVILSHVVEHIADLAEVSRLFDLVADRGLIYVEMPDPVRYEAFAQPQFGYYVDRLHINHFSQRSLLKLAPSHFDVVAGGDYPMPYILGEAYPAQYVALRSRPGPKDVRGAIESYMRSEAARWAKAHEDLQGRRFFIYGFGDNFHRGLSAGGPLHGLEGQIIAIIDRNAQALAAQDQAAFRFVAPTEIAEIDGGLIVCTVSQFTDMADFFADAYPRSEIINI